MGRKQENISGTGKVEGIERVYLEVHEEGRVAGSKSSQGDTVPAHWSQPHVRETTHSHPRRHARMHTCICSGEAAPPSREGKRKEF